MNESLLVFIDKSILSFNNSGSSGASASLLSILTLWTHAHPPRKQIRGTLGLKHCRTQVRTDCVIVAFHRSLRVLIRPTEQFAFSHVKDWFRNALAIASLENVRQLELRIRTAAAAAVEVELPFSIPYLSEDKQHQMFERYI
jgi:hypothetical protein